MITVFECQSPLSVAGLSKQVAQQFLRSMSAMAITDLTPHVEVMQPTVIPYLQRSAGDDLIAAIKERGEPLKLIDALRTLPQQLKLSARYLNGVPLDGPTALPGSSGHERGVAIDIEDSDRWVTVLRKHNWHRAVGHDSAHFFYHGPQQPAFQRAGIMAFQRVWNDHNPDEQLPLDGVLTAQTEYALGRSPAGGF